MTHTVDRRLAGWDWFGSRGACAECGADVCPTALYESQIDLLYARNIAALI